MGIGLLGIVVPTILILVILILYVNSRTKRIIKEVEGIKTQLENSDAAAAGDRKEPAAVIADDAGPEKDTVVVDSEDKKEEQDAEAEEEKEPAASAYNTGKSGKIYTKEELELLIKE